MKIRPYTKREIAVMYFPMTPTARSAVRNLSNYMKKEQELMSRLSETGYSEHAKTFTARQVRLLIEYLGEP